MLHGKLKLHITNEHLFNMWCICSLSKEYDATLVSDKLFNRNSDLGLSVTACTLLNSAQSACWRMFSLPPLSGATDNSGDKEVKSSCYLEITGQQKQHRNGAVVGWFSWCLYWLIDQNIRQLFNVSFFQWSAHAHIAVDHRPVSLLSGNIINGFLACQMRQIVLCHGIQYSQRNRERSCDRCHINNK
jgi:hypothetical protein